MPKRNRTIFAPAPPDVEGAGHDRAARRRRPHHREADGARASSRRAPTPFRAGSPATRCPGRGLPRVFALAQDAGLIETPDGRADARLRG